MFTGDILYHGPRNDLPKGVCPQEVLAMLNGCKDRIYCVRGNCDTEVDQMVLEFPVMADYALLAIDGITIYATHGRFIMRITFHPCRRGCSASWHTHVLRADRCGDITILNPGSVSIPKGRKSADIRDSGG